MTPAQRQALLQTLQARFGQHMQRHARLVWAPVQARLELAAHAGQLQALQAMEDSGGEPDVIGQDGDTYLFCDCSAESPPGRRSLCYDREGLESRKEHRPAGSAVDQAAAMGLALLTEAQYLQLQQLGSFDTKTSSWLHTPADLRALGGALFADRRYGRVFVYHNGAQSYYAARGFRGLVRI